ncbi:Tat-linked quality control protein TatD [bioreactor metagenome]|uniref:Tat-linked quality control protein TatD n=1 Tax=bioreactor metagenome TaxID=1076179 RepID=A0A644YHI4_9ZZZZ
MRFYNRRFHIRQSAGDGISVASMHYYDIHTHNKSQSPSVTSILNVIPGQAVPESFFSAGIHPWYAESTSVEDLRKYGSNPHCVAIGECGLDAVKSSIPFDEQKILFRAHLELALQYSKPVVLHVVRSTNELFQILKEFPELVYIWHGFNENKETFRQFERFDMYFSCGQRGLRKPEIWRSVPAERLLCETDEAIAQIDEIYSALAAIRNESIEDLAGIIQQNVIRIFGNELEGKD